MCIYKWFVRDRTRKIPKLENQPEETNEANLSSSRNDVEETSLWTSTGSCVTGRLFDRISAQRIVHSEGLESEKPLSIYDIIEGEINPDSRKGNDGKSFRVFFKPTRPDQMEETESFFVGLLDNLPEEVMQPDPDDYVTPVRMQRLMNTATVTTSTSRSSTSGQNFKNQMEKSASLDKPSTSSIFKIPHSVPSRFSARCVNEDISVYEASLNTPRNYTSLPNLTPISTHKVARRASERSFRIPSSIDSATSRINVMKNKSSGKNCKSSTTPSSDNSYFIIGISSGRGCAIGEIGMAAIDLKRPSFILCQYSDSQTYQKTLAKLSIYQPTEVLIPDTLEASHNDLFLTLTNYFKETKIVSVKRQYFNSAQGLEAMRNLCNADYSHVDLVILNKYYALCAAAALVMYVEHKHRANFMPHTLKVAYESVEGSVIIDLETARRLELVTSENSIMDQNKYTLFGLMNNTVTVSGHRRLRMEILQPYSSRHIIEKRLDKVQYLVENEDKLGSLQKVLLKFSNVERLLWMCSKNKFISSINSNVTPPSNRGKRQANEAHICEVLTNYILLLKQNIDDLFQLKEVLSNIDQECFTNIKDKLEDQRYNTIKEKIAQVLHEDSKPARGFQAAELNRCFCIKQEVNGLLDAARVTYSKLLDNMQDLIGSYSEQCGLEMSLCLTSDLGFHVKFVLGKRQDPITFQLPAIFTNVKRRGNVYHASTIETFSYNARISRVVQEIQLITNAVLLELLDDLRSYVGCVYNLCEVVSELDVISSLAIVSCQKDYVRPIFSSDLIISAGRHPILDKFDSNPIPNNTYASRDKNFNIITGPNMAGKSVYVLQVALLQLMAQVGSYVPAASAELRVTDHIFVRKGLIDSLECNASSFVCELKEIMYTIENIKESSLLILDEICTGVKSDEGTAVAWAISESFLKRPAFTFITTHYHFLTNLEKIYPNVTNYQMEAVESTEEGIRFGPLVYTYRLIDGVTQISNYGIRLLLQTALPESIKMDAVKFSEQLLQRRATAFPIVQKLRTDQTKLMARVDEVEGFMKQLYKASIDNEKFTLALVRKFQKLAIRKFCNTGNKDHMQTKGRHSSVKITEINAENKEGNSDMENVCREGSINSQNGVKSNNSNVRVDPHIDKTGSLKVESLPPKLISLHTSSLSTNPSTVTV
ncbi:mutS protein homolog 4-like isoform X2 [Rhodnius prolixus]|uniref:mutS protein homolog 4-like isoform X2 n=1 Tax=Rhodnius prolixus TaxID=13249 RepID=UPI003D189E88